MAAVTRPRVYTLPEAAARMGVSERTIRQWLAGTNLAGHRLQPVPGSLEMLGYHLFVEPALVEAERANQHGRGRRKADACVSA